MARPPLIAAWILTPHGSSVGILVHRGLLRGLDGRLLLKPTVRRWRAVSAAIDRAGSG